MTLDLPVSASTFDPSYWPGDTSSGAASPRPAADPALVQQTKNEIRGLVRELTELSRSEVSVEEFFEAFLLRVTAALAAVGGAIWTTDSSGALRLRYHVNLSQTGLLESTDSQAKHARLLKRALDKGQPSLIPPHAASFDDQTDAANPTDSLLILGVLQSDTERLGIVELFQPPRGGPVAQRGYLRFVVQMCELATEFFKSDRLRALDRRLEEGRRREVFLTAIHESLDPGDVSLAIAGEGRRLLGADRVSVSVRHGRGQRIAAVSGAADVDRRAETIVRLERLAATVAACGEPVVFDGGSQELAPQLQDALQAYVDIAHCRGVVVQPMFARAARGAADSDADGEAGDVATDGNPVIGCLIIERFDGEAIGEPQLQRVRRAADAAAMALANAMRQRRSGWLPGIGQSRSLNAAAPPHRRLVLAAAASAVLISLAAIVPAELRVRAEGRLLPVERQEVYALADGIVEAVEVEHGDRVVAGEVLLRMRNVPTEVELASLDSRLATTREQMHAIRRAMIERHGLTDDARDRLSSELGRLEQLAAGLQRERVLQQQQRDALTVRSPRDGQIVTWDVDRRLAGRPVKTGQMLMSVVDPTGPWELEMFVSQHDVGCLPAASGDRPAISPPVEFQLRTHPGRRFRGHLVEVQRSTTRGETDDNVLVRAAVVDPALPRAVAGTRVVGRIDCGRRAIGYVWFRDLIEAVRGELLFWLT